MRKPTSSTIARCLLAALAFTLPATASESGSADPDAAAELARKLQNPVASLISVPLQANWDFGIGSEDATRFTLNIQPVIPLTVNEEWNLITRTILPVIDAESPYPGIDDASGLGDVVQSFFLSPKAPSQGGWIWGAGPVLLYPTATDDLLGSEKWGAGPSAVLVKQEQGWTYGVLANHIWSFAGEGDRTDVSATFLQPFVSYTTKTHTTVSANTESTYDWEAGEWNVPLNFQVSQLLKIGNQPLSVGIGRRYYAETPEGGPEWGVRAVVQFLFPK